MRKIFCSIAFASLILVLDSCGDTEPQLSVIPVISSINPSSGHFDTIVTIEGSHFNPTIDGNSVKINGATATITSATESKILIKVPLSAGTGKVTVTTDKGSAEGPEFTYNLVGIVTTFAGNGVAGYSDGTGLNVQFNFPSGLAFDASDNLFVSDRQNNRIRKITPEGIVSTFAGDGSAASVDGMGTAAKLNQPVGLFFDSQGLLYVTEIASGNIRKITTDGQVTTVAGNGTPGHKDGDALSSQFSFPVGITMNQSGDLFVTDNSGHRIRKVSSGIVSTFAGNGIEGENDGTGSTARFNGPHGITMDDNGNLIVAEFISDRVRKISPQAVVTTIAGSEEGYQDGPAAVAQFRSLYGIAFDKDKNLIIADGNNHRIRLMDPGGKVYSIAGSSIEGSLDGIGAGAQFGIPYSVAVNSKGEIFIGDRSMFKIRKIVLH